MIQWRQSKSLKRWNHINYKISIINLTIKIKWVRTRTEIKWVTIEDKTKVSVVNKINIIEESSKTETKVKINSNKTGDLTKCKVEIKVDKTTKRSYVDTLKELAIANMETSALMHMASRIWDQKDKVVAKTWEDQTCNHLFQTWCLCQVWVKTWHNSKEWWCKILRWDNIWIQTPLLTCKILQTCNNFKTCKWFLIQRMTMIFKMILQE